MQRLFEDEKNIVLNNPSLFLERKLTTLFGANAMSIYAMDIVKEEMCKERGYTRQDGSDYYIHCIEVTNTLLAFCVKDEDVICAALLHDIIEDVEGYTKITIEKMFNPKVAKLVDIVTKDHDTDYHVHENMVEYLRKIRGDQDAAMIKTADRMHNMMSLETKTFQQRYDKALQTEKYYLPFFRECRYLYPRYENLFYMAWAQIEPLIFHIKTFYEALEKLEKLEKKEKKGKKGKMNEDEYK